MLLPIIKFAHNAWPHHSTHKSPFEVWYGIHPTFKPPLHLQTRLQSMDECIQYLEQVCKEVTAAQHLAAQEMRSGGPTKSLHLFYKDNLVLLEATNLQTTHLKAKLAPRRYGPFKVIWASPMNCKLKLPPQMRIHPVFHNSLLKPYTETTAHGPNFARPPPEIVREEEGHYKIKKILQSCPTRNCKSTQYLVYWKGYMEADCTWIPAKELTHAKELVTQFEATQKATQKSKEGIQALQEQGKPKEGILSWTKSTLSRNPVQTPTSPMRITPKPSYSQVAIRRPPEPATKPGQRPATKENLRPRDPGKSPPRDPVLQSWALPPIFRYFSTILFCAFGHLFPTHSLTRCSDRYQIT